MLQECVNLHIFCTEARIHGASFLLRISSRTARLLLADILAEEMVSHKTTVFVCVIK